VSLLSKEAEQIIDRCLSQESSEFKNKVVEILAKCEIQSNDPLFLVLLHTGQLRVFLEKAPQEIKGALNEWRKCNEAVITELTNTIEVLIREKSNHIKIMKSLIEGLTKTNEDLNQTLTRIENSIYNREKNTKNIILWLKFILGLLIVDLILSLA
jgi:uncharacterized protein YhaN